MCASGKSIHVSPPAGQFMIVAVCANTGTEHFDIVVGSPVATEFSARRWVELYETMVHVVLRNGQHVSGVNVYNVTGLEPSTVGPNRVDGLVMHMPFDLDQNESIVWGLPQWHMNNA